MKRILGHLGIEVSALGMGCWAIGGPWTYMGSPAGWGEVDDGESIRAIHAALDLGVNFFDSAARGVEIIDRVVVELMGGSIKRDTWNIPDAGGFSQESSGQ